MDARCYLEECKKKLGVATNYKLAQMLDIAENSVNFYWNGRNLPDEYACFKIAECLEIDPAIVIAEIKASGEKNEKKRAYFRTFRGACGKAAAGIMLALALSAFYVNAPPDGIPKLMAALTAAAASAAFLKRRYFA